MYLFGYVVQVYRVVHVACGVSNVIKRVGMLQDVKSSVIEIGQDVAVVLITGRRG